MVRPRARKITSMLARYPKQARSSRRKIFKGSLTKYKNKVYKFIRTYEAPSSDLWKIVGTGSTIGPFNFAVGFKLNSLPNYAEFQALYDQYKITRVDIMLRSNSMQSLDNTTPTSTHELPDWFFVIDNDDDTPITSTASYLQYHNLRFLSLTKNYTIRCYPRVAQMVYDGAITTAYSPATKPVWLDLANADVPHYGIKYGSGDSQYTLQNQAQAGWQVFYRYYVSFKEVR